MLYSHTSKWPKTASPGCQMAKFKYFNDIIPYRKWLLDLPWKEMACIYKALLKGTVELVNQGKAEQGWGWIDLIL